MNTPTLSINCVRFLALLLLVCFALVRNTQAVSPPPDGGYPGGNTAEGDNALFSLTTGVNNTATGFQALFSNTSGFENTANGVNALQTTQSATTIQPLGFKHS